MHVCAYARVCLLLRNLRSVSRRKCLAVCRNLLKWHSLSVAGKQPPAPVPACSLFTLFVSVNTRVLFHISHLSSHLSLSLSLTVWPRSCSSIGLEVCNHPLTLLLSQSLPGQTDPRIGKYPPLNVNRLSSLNVCWCSLPHAHQVPLSRRE
ncbi:hypothetical protein QQF64_026641 [Cirrhinus molitorella]|uniref:Uncharacterized protein n=1 Tax=Cirrhinus molitorella TaxID=172907 RepID=A0ABR3NA68_9TELE